MKKYFKKISALLMAAIMVLSMCTAVFAAGKTTSVPNPDDAAQVTINGLETGVTIKAYQIVDGVYTDNGFTGFTWTALAKNKGTTAVFDEDGNLNLTQKDLTDIVKTIKNDTAHETFKLDGDNKSIDENNKPKKLTVGTWLLLVNGGKKVYNPMVVSVYYATDDGTVTGGRLEAGEDWKLVGGVTYAKETDITIDKVADKDTAAHGEDVEFTITGVIPSYSAEYTDVTYTISDTLKNLELKEAPVVKLAGTQIDAKNYTYSKTDTGFTIAFKSDYIKGLANKTDVERKVTVTYTAIVTADATTWNPAKNEARVDYTNNPDGKTTYKETKTKTYTFDIDGQILKVDETGEKPLPGATFTLYKEYNPADKTVSNEIASYKTLTEGKIIFKGLAAGTYYLKETEAPASYTLNTTIYEITITPKYTEATKNNEEGKKELESYSVTVKEAGSTAEGETGTYTEGSAISKLIDIQNTKVGQLPSTGGMGTYIFTIAGVVLMACAAGAFIISRKKSSEE